MSYELIEYVRYLIYVAQDRDLGDGLTGASASPWGRFSQKCGLVPAEVTLLENSQFPGGFSDGELEELRAPESSRPTFKRNVERLRRGGQSTLSRIATVLHDSPKDLGLAKNTKVECGYSVVNSSKLHDTLSREMFNVVVAALKQKKQLRRGWFGQLELRPQYDLPRKLLEEILATSNGQPETSTGVGRAKEQLIRHWLMSAWDLTSLRHEEGINDERDEPLCRLTYWWRLAHVLTQDGHEVTLRGPIRDEPKTAEIVIGNEVAPWTGSSDLPQNSLITEMKDALSKALGEHQLELLRELEKRLAQRMALEEFLQNLLDAVDDRQNRRFDILKQSLEERDQRLLEKIEPKRIVNESTEQDSPPLPPPPLPPPLRPVEPVVITATMLKKLFGKTQLSKDRELVRRCAKMKVTEWINCLTVSDAVDCARKAGLKIKSRLTKAELIDYLRKELKKRLVSLESENGALP